MPSSPDSWKIKTCDRECLILLQGRSRFVPLSFLLPYPPPRLSLPIPLLNICSLSFIVIVVYSKKLASSWYHRDIFSCVSWALFCLHSLLLSASLTAVYVIHCQLYQTQSCGTTNSLIYYVNNSENTTEFKMASWNNVRWVHTLTLY